MSTPNDTLRAHLEAANESLERMACHPEDVLYVAACALDAQEHAIAALRILDEAELEYRDASGAPVPPAPVAATMDYSNLELVRLVPDPGGRAAPPPTTDA